MNLHLLYLICERWRAGRLRPRQLKTIYGLNDSEAHAIADFADGLLPGIDAPTLLARWPLLRPGLRGTAVRALIYGRYP